MLYAYKASSQSAKAISQALGVKRIKNQNSNYKGDVTKLVINWGASQVPEEVKKSTIVNHPDSVAVASDKALFFKTVAGKVSIPDFTTSPGVAYKWYTQGEVVVCRSTLKGSGGTGIDICDPENANAHAQVKDCLAKGKLFTKYVLKKEEYRVHVVDGEVIDARRKAKKKGHKGEVNWRVRNHANGFVFVKNGFELPAEVAEQAILAVKSCGLTFGGVDVVWNDLRSKAYVLEVNTAPGIEGSTIENYKEALNKLYEKWDEAKTEIKVTSGCVEDFLNDLFAKEKGKLGYAEVMQELADLFDQPEPPNT